LSPHWPTKALASLAVRQKRADPSRAGSPADEVLSANIGHESVSHRAISMILFPRIVIQTMKCRLDFFRGGGSNIQDLNRYGNVLPCQGMVGVDDHGIIMHVKHMKN